MTKLPIYQIDAFTDHVFGGNPAAIVPLKEWIPDKSMQNIAIENNLFVTGFFIQKDDGYHIRWFGPSAEVKFCGHATLAASHLIFEIISPEANEIHFTSLNGDMTMRREGHFISMNVPVWDVKETDVPEMLIEALHIPPDHVYEGHYWLATYESQKDIEMLQPNFAMLHDFSKAEAIICTAPASDPNIDFVSRFFCPRYGTNEDPVTGSAHSILTPYWAEKLGKKELIARQISARGGELKCKHLGDRVEIDGKAVIYMKGEIEI